MHSLPAVLTLLVHVIPVSCFPMIYMALYGLIMVEEFMVSSCCNLCFLPATLKNGQLSISIAKKQPSTIVTITQLWVAADVSYVRYRPRSVEKSCV